MQLLLLKGLTHIGLYTQEYKRAIYSIQMYADEIEKLNQADTTALSLANMYNTNSSKLQSDFVNSYY